jgi:ribonuclease R
VSGAGGRRRASAAETSGPAPDRSFVAVLERRGRFLTAEPMFPRREAAGASPRRRGAAGLVVGPAGSVRAEGVRASAGDIALVQRSARGSGARVLRVIGRPQVARDVIEALMLDRGLARGFSEEVEREARAAAEHAARSDRQRRDLRDLPTFTIDPVTAKDLDDAISAELLDDGTARVWVHIADVTAHVREESVLDREARRRATSVYVPGAVEPMLPRALSNEACSLHAGVERRAVTVELLLRGPEVLSAVFYRSLICSDQALDYDRVDRIFAGEEPAEEPWAEPLRAARVVAGQLQREREQAGALIVDSSEPEVEFDREGNVSQIRGRVQTESHRLVEHLMIAANEAVAAMLAERDEPTLFRVHEPPDPESVQRLVDQLASLGVPTPPMPDRMSSTQAAELVGAISHDVERHVRRTGVGRLGLSSLVLRSLKQAYYSPKNLGHAGLHSASYCHFTSPIRRYPDIVCHRALLAAVGAGEQAPRASELAELGAWTSERERDAMTIERDADDVAGCFALERLLYESGHEQVFVGEITGLISAGAFLAFGPADEEAVHAGAPPFEGMLPVRVLSALTNSGASPSERSGAARSERRPAERSERATGSRARGRNGRPGTSGRGGRPGGGPDGERDWWELNEQGTILQGQRSGRVLRLGDRVEVRVARVDAIRGRVDLTPAG